MKIKREDSKPYEYFSGIGYFQLLIGGSKTCKSLRILENKGGNYNLHT